MTSENDDAERHRLTRRATLKGLGAAGAAAWVAPQILSTPGAAAASAPTGCVDCGPDPCNDQPACGADCSCTQNYPAGNGCTCTQNVACAGLTPCDGVTPCPQGFTCQVGCCGTPLCFPLCA
jgi:hypothetical protein